eukprot:TRINITY_DN7342_c0_g1_i1.p1 TRINITY_DN7342_c0_g1~~TRINITY_DN7342_c0_g1_i1.p1  ORF type:complete len:485 (-),score=74.43 TRINITY_DN7342_c0_g1_i1:81-1475(-)
MITEASLEGRTAKQDALLFSLAYCCRSKDLETKKAAYANVLKICRIPTHLFMFIGFCEKIYDSSTGWGRAHRKAVSKWYSSQKAKKLIFACTKYKQREGWSHRDVLRLCHVKPQNAGHALAYKYLTRGYESIKDFRAPDGPEGVEVTEVLKLIHAVHAALAVKDKPEEIIDLIKEHGLAREHIPTNFLNNKEVWQALVGKMGMTAMIRNLGKMTSLGLIAPGTPETVAAVAQFGNIELLKSSRIHPLNLLAASRTYAKGKGDKGALTWFPVPEVINALDEAFYSTFKFVQPTGKRIMLAIDVSGSMEAPIVGMSSITCREGAAAMAMVTKRTEPNCTVMGFSHEFVPLEINATMKLSEVIATIEKVPMGATDCALPMMWAQKNAVPVDVFIIYTDSETYFGDVHPAQALRSYRKVMGIDAKMIVIGLGASEFSIADPLDPGMFDMVGFDTSGPEIINNFILGNF